MPLVGAFISMFISILTTTGYVKNMSMNDITILTHKSGENIHAYIAPSDSFGGKFPATSCSDFVSQDDGRIYFESSGLKLYPVYAEYTRENLRIIRENLCKDAFIVSTEGTKVIQVASFTSPQKANAFVYALKETKNNIKVMIGNSITITIRGRDFEY